MLKAATVMVDKQIRLLAVLDEGQQLLGILSEAYATRRYAEELEKNRRDLVGGE